MKHIKLIILVLAVLMLSGCVSMVKEEKLVDWALGNGYILAADCPNVPEVPERQPLDHPKVPYLQVQDDDGEYIPITEQYLMEIIIKLFGTVEKYQFLAEIYEREYLNAGGQIMPDLTLEELKALYLKRINAIDAVPEPKAEEEPTVESIYLNGTTNGTTPGDYITIEEFSTIVEAFNYFQKNGEQ